MVVRTGGDKTAPAKSTKKRATKKNAAVEEPEDFARPVSTLVSSPIRRAARKSKKGKGVANYFDEEAIAEGEEEEDMEQSGAMHPNGYEQDGFVVADDEEDEYFEPVRPAPRQRRQRTLDELGPPISRVPDQVEIDDIHNDIVAAFLEEAKKLEEDLRNMKGIRRVLFTEAQLQQMAIRWTTTIAEMRDIPGINTDNVDRFGVKFIPLVLRFHGMYREMMGDGEDAMATIPATAGPMHSRHGPLQSNDVVDLVSDDDEDDGDYEEPGVPSKYFGANTHQDPIQSQLESWNARFSRTTQFEDSEPAPRGRGTSKKGSHGGKRNHYRKNGGSSRGASKSYSGVSKGKGPTSAGSNSGKRTSAGSSKSAASKSTVRPGGGRGGGGGSGIGLMPF